MCPQDCLTLVGSTNVLNKVVPSGSVCNMTAKVDWRVEEVAGPGRTFEASVKFITSH